MNFCNFVENSDQMEKLVEFSNVTQIKDISESYSQIDDSYLFSHIVPGTASLSKLITSDPHKLGGTLLMLMRKGTPFKYEINQEEFTVSPGCFVVTFPGSVSRVKTPLEDDVEMYAMFFELKFLQNLNINLASVSMPPMLQKPTPLQQLSDSECDLLCRYFELIHINTIEGPNMQITKTVASSLVVTMFYQLVQFYHKRMAGELDSTVTSQQPGRRHDYVREFVRLVHLHYVRERSVAFYADKLYISPKYLSLLVKEATGRSAAKWIDDFVLMEAKNMLRFSGKNIQQVAYALNFPTQSSFGKYFKHLTGMSPTEYQKS